MCAHTAFGTAAVKMKPLLHPEMAYRKILCFKKHKDSRSCMIRMTTWKLYENVQVLQWGNSAVLQKRQAHEADTWRSQEYTAKLMNIHITTHHCIGYHSMKAQVSQIPVKIKVIFWKFTFYILQQNVILHYKKEISTMNMQIHEPSCAEKLSMHLARTNSSCH